MDWIHCPNGIVQWLISLRKISQLLKTTMKTFHFRRIKPRLVSHPIEPIEFSTFFLINLKNLNYVWSLQDFGRMESNDSSSYLNSFQALLGVDSTRKIPDIVKYCAVIGHSKSRYFWPFHRDKSTPYLRNALYCLVLYPFTSHLGIIYRGRVLHARISLVGHLGGVASLRVRLRYILLRGHTCKKFYLQNLQLLENVQMYNEFILLIYFFFQSTYNKFFQFFKKIWIFNYWKSTHPCLVQRSASIAAQATSWTWVLPPLRSAFAFQTVPIFRFLSTFLWSLVWGRAWRSPWSCVSKRAPRWRRASKDRNTGKNWKIIKTSGKTL